MLLRQPLQGSLKIREVGSLLCNGSLQGQHITVDIIPQHL